MVAGWMMLDTNPGNALMRPPTQVETDGAFRPSESQWAGFRFAKVEPVAFREERATDGRIAINEDTTTPVFSPYSGRVSRLIAKPGEHVERGAPLFAIEASEFVQGHNDLVTAVAGVDKAKSRLALAQMAEKRQRDLQAIRGGALKDLEQAQSDLVQAQGDLRAAEITLAAVRNRLRILGRSDEEIADLEKRDRVGAETIVAAPIAGTVIQRKVGLGQYINAGANDPIYTIGDLSTVWLVANVRESDAPKMKVGARSTSPCSPSPARCSTPSSTMWRRPSIPTRAACRCAPRSGTPISSSSPRCSPPSASSRAKTGRCLRCRPIRSSTRAPTPASGWRTPTARPWCRVPSWPATPATGWSRSRRG